MKYSDIIGISPYFQDVFDIMNENGNYWKNFIITDQFETILDNVLDSFTTNDDHRKKSIWIQGNYGTGKSHSTSVVMHLLGDNYTDIEDFFDQIENIQLKERLAAFRLKKRVFPVALKGVNAIVDINDLKYAIQNAIRSALKFWNIECTTKTDFDLMIDIINSADFREFWERTIKDDFRISMYANTISDLVDQLSKYNNEVLRLLTSVLKNKQLTTTIPSIEEWLIEVLQSLKEQKIADYIVIFWDEFTSVIDTNERKALLTQIQNIAELSNLDVFLYLVNHRNIDVLASFKDLQEDEKTKAKARFRQISYDMQPYTTYHVISSAIRKKNEEKWSQLKKKYVDDNISINDVISKLVQNMGQSVLVKEKINNIYPIHPYAAYLATFISRNIGSTERSIFKFLNDDQYGFKKFLENDLEVTCFLTAEYMWDFFLNDFEQDNISKFDTVINKYKLFYDQVCKMGELHLAVFKVTLLLNILYKMTMTNVINDEKSLVIPTEDNITMAFRGICQTDLIRDVLGYIDENQIIHKSPDGIFEIAFTSLPPKQVVEEIRRQYSQCEDITKLLDRYQVDRDKIKNELSRSMCREIEVNYFWGGQNEFHLLNKCKSSFKKPYALSIAVILFRGETKYLDTFLNRSEKSINETFNLVKNISTYEECRNILFIIVEECMGNKRMEGYVENYASSIVAQNHGFHNEKAEYEERALKWLRNWIESIRSSESILLFRGEHVNKPFNSLSHYFATEVSKIVFSSGLEKTNITTESVWALQTAKAVVESFIATDTREEFEMLLSKKGNYYAYLKNILRDGDGDYIIDDKTNFKENISEENPLYKISKSVNEAIEKAKGKAVLHLGETLNFLHKPPFGLYKNPINMATMAFVMRPYIQNIYREGTGKVFDKNIMRDTVVSLFNYWQDGKEGENLRIRFSTDEERTLVDILSRLFNLGMSEGIVKTKWAVRNQFNEKHSFPLWALKYVVETNEKINITLDKLFNFTKKHDDEIQQHDIIELVELLQNNYVDISNAVLTAPKEDGLKAFLLRIDEDRSINEKDIPEIILYLESTLQDNRAFWEEKDIIPNVWKWVAKRNQEEIEKLEDKKILEGQKQSTITSDAIETKGGLEDEQKKTRKDKIVNRIKSYSGSIEDLKSIIIYCIEDYPEVARYLESYLN